MEYAWLLKLYWPLVTRHTNGESLALLKPAVMPSTASCGVAKPSITLWLVPALVMVNAFSKAPNE